ncbi:cytidine deaminase [Balneolaceae bacterium YR4-1]|uniref:Cytidine deaminase n=1 Tax=Halalkalibaculum roseum TaxID=2709311 RepID=A0A6M1SXD5_9BACT|nr:cytidine deaminase [Halalkalibaculum roseum]NGP76908.1 cytidine deaminase [Halalkalibaculum roseum]
MMNIEQLKDSNYVPYSGKSSVAVVKSVAGNYYPGVRVENVTFPLTINAAQNALFTCLSEKERPKAIYVEDTKANDLEFWRNEYNVWVYPHEELETGDLKEILLDLQESEIKSTLKKLLDHAVTENSDFPVSALLKTPRGYVSGVNIECSEWSLGLCAERVAIGKALSYGIKDFESIYIHTRSGEYSSPCGACRQVIYEHMPHNPVHLFHADGTRSKHFSSDLLPYSFRSTSLNVNARQ